MKPEQLLELLDKAWRNSHTIDDQALWGYRISTQDVRDFVAWINETQTLLFRAAQLYEESFDDECECGKGDSCKHCAKIGHARSLVYKALQKYPYLADEGKAHTPNIELLQELEPTVECTCTKCGLTWTKITCSWNWLWETWVCRRCGNRLSFMQPKLKQPTQNEQLAPAEQTPSEQSARPPVRIKSRRWFQRLLLSRIE